MSSPVTNWEVTNIKVDDKMKNLNIFRSVISKLFCVTARIIHVSVALNIFKLENILNLVELYYICVILMHPESIYSKESYFVNSVNFWNRLRNFEVKVSFMIARQNYIFIWVENKISLDIIQIVMQIECNMNMTSTIDVCNH